MRKQGWTISGNDDIPIAPVMIGDAKTALDFANLLLDEGILAKGLAYPIVAKGASRIRVQLSSTHQKEHLDQAIEAFGKCGKQMGLL